MVGAVQQHTRRSAVGAGIGGVAFTVLTFAAFVLAKSPGGDYSASAIAAFLASGHRLAVIAAFHLALLGLLGLLALLGHLCDALDDRRAASIVRATAIAAAACFAVGWGVIGGEVVAHLEGGRAIAVAPAVTYLISEVGVVFIFGCGAVLLGLALIALAVSARVALPGWLRWLTLACGVAGVAGLAFFPFFLLVLWGVAAGVWTIRAGRRT